MHCDIVKESIIGQEFRPILDIIACRNLELQDMTKNAYYTLPNPAFKSVKKTKFNCIRMTLHTLDGRVISTKVKAGSNADKDGLTYNLLFRKKCKETDQ